MKRQEISPGETIRHLKILTCDNNVQRMMKGNLYFHILYI